MSLDRTLPWQPERMAATIPPQRVSHEKAAIDALSGELGSLPGVTTFSGLAAPNRVDPGWDLPANQRFQFGDLRIEAPGATIVVEFESAGGVTNLVKYWPLLLRRSHPKRFVLAHVFRIVSANDYIAHRRLWEFLVERMRDDLDRHGVSWGEAWEARAFTYPAEALDVNELAQFVRGACHAAG